MKLMSSYYTSTVYKVLQAYSILQVYSKRFEVRETGVVYCIASHTTSLDHSPWWQSLINGFNHPQKVEYTDKAWLGNIIM